MTKKQFPSFVEILNSVEKLNIAPTSNDTLFSKNETEDERRNMAYLNHGNWSVYICGYKNAADILVSHVENGAGHDLLVYPIMFLYRQCFELAIKGIIIKAEKRLDISPSKSNGHDLEALWIICQEHLLLIPDLTNEDSEGLNQVTRLIKEFCTVDRQSDGFRYPTTGKERKPSLSNITQIPLTQMHGVAEKIYNVLNNKYMQLANMEEHGYNF